MLDAIDTNDWERADAEYSLIKGYGDADDNAVDITIGKAEKLMEEKKYLAANKLLSSYLSENEKVTALKKDVQYLLALSYFEGNNGQKQDYEKAAEIFSTLMNDDEYGADAAEYLYQCAVKLYSSEVTKEKATDIFENIPNYKDAQNYLPQVKKNSYFYVTPELLEGTWVIERTWANKKGGPDIDEKTYSGSTWKSITTYSNGNGWIQSGTYKIKDGRVWETYKTQDAIFFDTNGNYKQNDYYSTQTQEMEISYIDGDKMIVFGETYYRQ